jgi:hypothetical protein
MMRRSRSEANARPHMRLGWRTRAFAVAAVCSVMGAAPIAAIATTGTNTDKRTVVTISHTGVTYKPALSTLGLKTGVTLRLKVVNKASKSHSFSFGIHKTKVMRPGKSYTFFYDLDTPGKYLWKVHGGGVKGKAFHGTYMLAFPSHFH